MIEEALSQIVEFAYVCCLQPTIETTEKESHHKRHHRGWLTPSDQHREYKCSEEANNQSWYEYQYVMLGIAVN